MSTLSPLQKKIDKTKLAQALIEKLAFTPSGYVPETSRNTGFLSESVGIPRPGLSRQSPVTKGPTVKRTAKLPPASLNTPKKKKIVPLDPSKERPGLKLVGQTKGTVLTHKDGTPMGPVGRPLLAGGGNPIFRRVPRTAVNTRAVAQAEPKPKPVRKPAYKAPKSLIGADFRTRAAYIRSQGGDPSNQKTWNRKTRTMMSAWWNNRKSVAKKPAPTPSEGGKVLGRAFKASPADLAKATARQTASKAPQTPLEASRSPYLSGLGETLTKAMRSGAAQTAKRYNKPIVGPDKIPTSPPKKSAPPLRKTETVKLKSPDAPGGHITVTRFKRRPEQGQALARR